MLIIIIPESKLLARLPGVGDGCWALASLAVGVPVVVMVGFVLAVAVVEEPAVLPAVPPTSDGLGEVNDSTPDVDCCSGSFCWAAEIVIS